MDEFVVPNWLCIVLLALTALSFIPQCARFWTGKGTRDISLFYVFFNLVSALEQFLLLLCLGPLFGNEPVEKHDIDLTGWLNFAQGSVVLLLFLILFILCLFSSPASLSLKRGLVFFFVFLLFVTLEPVIEIRLTCDMLDGRPDMGFAGEIIIGSYMYLGNPVATFLGVTSLYFQLRYARAISSTGLLMQAVVFALVALSWLTRIPLDISGRGWYEWYEFKGWAFVDNAIFAILQLLLFIARYDPEQEDVDEGLHSSDEQEPLLRGE